MTQTLGEYRVGTTFNPSASTAVDQIKKLAADFINLVDALPADNPEVIRLKSLAMTHAEDAAMWAVKAATKPQRA